MHPQCALLTPWTSALAMVLPVADDWSRPRNATTVPIGYRRIAAGGKVKHDQGVNGGKAQCVRRGRHLAGDQPASRLGIDGDFAAQPRRSGQPRPAASNPRAVAAVHDNSRV